MRIAILTRNFSARGGGAERYSVETAKRLCEHHEVHVFAQTFDAPPDGLLYHRVGMPVRRPRWVNQLYFAWTTWGATRSGFDHVISHENSWHGDIQVVHVLPVAHTLFAGKTGMRRFFRWIKVFSSPRLLAYLLLEKSRYRSVPGRQIVVTSKTLHDRLAHCYPKASFRMKQIAPGIDQVSGWADQEQRRFARAHFKLPADGSVLLFVGNDFRKKGLPSLLSAVRAMPTQPHLLVVGDGRQTEAMKDMTHTLGLTQRVHFAGSLDDVRLAYRAADVLVHPTLEDTFAMVVLEAMAHGLPVVVSHARYCGIAAEMKDGREGLILANPESAQDLAVTLQRLLEQPELAHELQKNGLRFAAARTWDQAVSAFGGLFEPPRQRWLILAHAFNMDGRAASQTITDKIPHLRAAGIEPVVLSGVSGTLDREIEHYQLWPALPAGIKFELRHVLRKHMGHGGTYRWVSLTANLVLLPGVFLEKLFRPVESSWSWWISAYVKGRLLLKHRRFDVIYSTGGAFAAHLAGRALQRHSGLRWLAEVHDPMVMPGSAPTTAHERMQARIEGVICKHADVAVWFTQSAMASARRRHPQLGGRGHAMLPGVDNPFDVLPSFVRGPKMVLGHFGSLSASRNLVPIFSAIEKLQLVDSDVGTKLELQITGGPMDPVSAAYLSQSGIQGLVKHAGRIEADPLTGRSGRDQILERMRKADVLVLLHGTEAICSEYIPSKLYEYLWMQRPILATVHQHPQMAELLKDLGHTVANDDEALSKALGQLFLQWKAGGLPDTTRTSPYTTRASVKQLLEWAA